MVRMNVACLGRFLTMAVALFVLVGCGTTPAPDYGGRWRPVNNYTDTPLEIPLSSAYVFQSSPMDGTLKSMLARWAEDTNVQLDYRLGSDYTLYAAVAQIGTASIQDAAAQLSSAYASQGVAVSVVGNTIVVQQAASAASN